MTHHKICALKLVLAIIPKRLGEHVPAATNQHATIDVLLGTGRFYVVRAEEL
jgi:hypothetical protein